MNDRKIFRFLKSMKFGVSILALLALLSLIGTVIPQNNSLSFYESNYTPFMFSLIKSFSLYKMYTAWWFIFMMSILTLNLILCTIARLPGSIRQMNKTMDPLKAVKNSQHQFNREFKSGFNPEEIFRGTGFRKVLTLETDSGTYSYSGKNRLGYLGSFFIHLGILFIIVFFFLGKALGFETFIHGVPGTITGIEGTDYKVEILDYRTDLREDYTVEQYVTKLKVTSEKEDFVKQGEVKVNHPFRLNRLNIYQNGTGYALDFTFSKKGILESETILYQNEAYFSKDGELAVQFYNFYPDFTEVEGRLLSKTPFLSNPVMLYVVYYQGEKVVTNIAKPSETVALGDYSFVIQDPREFTLLQVVSDPMQKGAYLGGIILLAGIFMAFYMIPKELYLFQDKNGKATVCTSSGKNGEMHLNEIKEKFLDLNDGGND